MTVEKILEAVRSLVADDSEETAQVLSDEQYIPFINDGMRYIFYKYPDSRLASSGQAVNDWADANADTPQASLVIDDAYFAPMVEYVASRFFTRDAGDVRDQSRAAAHYKAFLELLSPVGRA